MSPVFQSYLYYRVNTQLFARYWVAWKPDCLPANWLFGNLGLCQLWGNPAVNQLRGCVETQLFAGYGVMWKSDSVLATWSCENLGSMPATGSHGNPVVCQLQGHVETRLCAGYLVTWRPQTVPATELR